MANGNQSKPVARRGQSHTGSALFPRTFSKESSGGTEALHLVAFLM